MMDKLEKELREAEPEKRDRFIKKALSLLELSAESLNQKWNNKEPEVLIYITSGSLVKFNSFNRKFNIILL